MTTSLFPGIGAALWMLLGALPVAALAGVPSEPAGAPVAAVAASALTLKEAEQLLRQADRALLRPPAALPVVHTEGTLPTAAGYKLAVQAKADWIAMAALASAYAVAHAADPSGARAARYRDGYEQYLSSWLDVYNISGNPIDESGLGHWLLAFRVAGQALTVPTQQRMRAFACKLSARYQQRMPPSRGTSTNNWQSHRVKLAVMGALTCSTPALVNGAQQLFEEQVRANLAPSGQSIDFAQRDALHYVVYSLEPLVEAALFASFDERPLYRYTGPQGQSIARGLEWLLPYASGQRTHEEFVHSSVPFDKARADAGVAGYSGLFKPELARHLYWLAAQLDIRWAATSQDLGIHSIVHRAAWQIIKSARTDP